MDIKTSNGELKTYRVSISSVLVGMALGITVATTVYAMKFNEPTQIIEPVPITPEQIAELVGLICNNGVTAEVVYTAYSPKIMCFVNREKK